MNEERKGLTLVENPTGPGVSTAQIVEALNANLEAACEELVNAACGLHRGGHRAPGRHVYVTIETWDRLERARREYTAALLKFSQNDGIAGK